MKPGIELKVLYSDEYVTKLNVSAGNGVFSGESWVYEGGLSEIADHLVGFPESPSGTRSILIGTFDPRCAGGGIQMRFHCIDGAAHAYDEVRIDSKYAVGGTIQTVTLTVPVDAAAVDSFVVALRRLAAMRAGVARLEAKL